MASLRLGSSGTSVKNLQKDLNKALKPSPKLKVDGQFGPSTDKAVRVFQRKNKLKVDGIVGPKTSAMIKQQAAGGNTQKKASPVKMDVFDYRQRKKSAKDIMVKEDAQLSQNARNHEMIINKSMRITKNAQEAKDKAAKTYQGLGSTLSKWHQMADKIIKLQDAFKIAEKRGDTVKQLELKKEVDKLHPGAEKLRLTIKNTLNTAHSFLGNKDKLIEKDAAEIIKLVKSNPHRGGGQSGA
jgi:murein L,D-transpeptidase YcbB/YkuD